MLHRLNALAAELETGAAKSLYRFGATRAYDEVMRVRLEAIGERPCPARRRWPPFSPAASPPRSAPAPPLRPVRTIFRKSSCAPRNCCARASKSKLESQNQDVLRSMNERVRMQLRLQQTVEGLSVAAITYYIASIAHLMLEGAHKRAEWLDPTLATALAVPFIFAFVWWNVRRLRKRHHVD